MIEKVRNVTLHAPADAQITGNGNACAVAPGHSITVVAELFKGDVADVTLTPQGNDAAGTGWIALNNNMRLWAAADTGTSDTLVRGTDAVAFSTSTFSGAGVDTVHRIVLKIDPDSLGLHTTVPYNPITQFQVVVAPGHADDRGSVTAYLTPLRYKP